MIARGANELLPYVGADDIWRGYSGEDVIYYGIPRAGLVAWHDLWFPNVITYSETFSLWSLANTAWTANAVNSPRTGLPTAGFVSEKNTDDTYHMAVIEPPIAGDVTWAVVAKAKERSWLKVTPDSFYNKGVSFDLANGTKGTEDAGYTGVITPMGDGWYHCAVYGAIGTGASKTGIRLGIADGCVNYVGTVGYGLYVADAQLYPSATLPPYASTTTLQAIPDLSGNGNTLVRGSNADAADTNDPTVLGPGLGFVDDDYAKTGVISGVTVGGPLTVIVAGKHEYDSDGQWASLGNSTANWACFYSETATSLKTSSRANGASPATTSAAGLTIVDSINYVLALTSQPNGVLTLTRLDNMASVSGAENAPLTVDPIFTLGSVAAGNYNLNDGTLYESLLYNRVLTAAELQRIRRYIKSKWAARGVDVT